MSWLPVSLPGAAPTPTVIAAGTVADASSQVPTYSVQRLLAALIAALAFAGFLGAPSSNSPAESVPSGQTFAHDDAAGTIWQPTDDDRIVLAAHPETDARARRPGFARDVERRGNADERVAEFFSQLSRRAPT